MEKVKITVEQEKVMKRIDVYEGEPDVFDFLNKLTECDFPYKEKEYHKIDEQKEMRNIIKAFLFGYEVEPEFNLGDVLFHTKVNKVFRVKHPDLEHINKSHNKKHLRYATKSEVWWFENDRDVWELKDNDVIKINDQVEVIHEIEEGEMWFESDRYAILEKMKHNIEVVCFAQDRKDI